jgi:hypothetical protein
VWGHGRGEKNYGPLEIAGATIGIKTIVASSVEWGHDRGEKKLSPGVGYM